VKDGVPGSSPVGGDRWCIMSLAMRVGESRGKVGKKIILKKKPNFF
jgi:hypothetical protein